MAYAYGEAMPREEEEAMAAASWYVIQVPTGAERKLCDLIERMAPEGAVEECFSPQYATQIKCSGEWVDVEKPLLPGYVIVVTSRLDLVIRALREIPEFTRLLKMGESFVPLASDERAWIEALTNKGSRCVDMSVGVMDGEHVVVLSGPLRGREALITSVNRHKNLAFVELEICGRRVATKVGLGIVGRREDITASKGDSLRRLPYKRTGGGQLPVQPVDSPEVAALDDSATRGVESTVVPAPTTIPIAGTRESAKQEERSVRRLTLMRNAEAFDRERLGYRFVKRAFDIVFSACVIAVAIVPSAVLCAAIAVESPGCPLYRQRRVGRIGADGRPREFTMWKFRSMVKGADQMKDALLAENEVEGPMFKMRDDPRVTRIGRFIRRHSIDEFPQFLNVFMGDMSVVGPRPPLPREVAQYDEWAMQRLAVKPGLTGPWQVGGRSDVDFDDMVRLDLGYIARRSVAMDLKIILQTIAVVFTGKGAA